MSLVYSAKQSGFWFWFGGIALSAGLHFVVPTQIMMHRAGVVPERVDPLGVTGAISFDLSDIIAAPSTLSEDSVEKAESKQAPTVTQSPEVVKAAKAAVQPLLTQIPYEIEDDSLKFGVAAPEPEADVEDQATEIATEHDPEQVDAESQLGAEDSAASAFSTAGTESEQEAETAKAKAEGLTAEQTAEIQEWQKNIVLLISGAKTYPKKARRDRITGEVVVRFVLDSYGKVTVAQVAQSSGWPVLDKAAVTTVMEIGKMPTPPHYMDGDEFAFLIPLHYRFR